MVESYRAGYKYGIRRAKHRAISIAKERMEEIGDEEWNVGRFPSNCGESFRPNSIDDLYDLLLEYGPLYGYYVNSDNTSAHLIVVTGVNKTKGIVYTNNPLGVKGEQSFEEFLNGVARKSNQSNQDLHFGWVYTITI